MSWNAYAKNDYAMQSMANKGLTILYELVILISWSLQFQADEMNTVWELIFPPTYGYNSPKHVPITFINFPPRSFQ